MILIYCFVSFVVLIFVVKRISGDGFSVTELVTIGTLAVVLFALLSMIDMI